MVFFNISIPKFFAVHDDVKAKSSHAKLYLCRCVSESELSAVEGQEIPTIRKDSNPYRTRKLSADLILSDP